MRTIWFSASWNSKVLSFCFLEVIQIRDLTPLRVLHGLKYASSHEWVKYEGFVATIGLTDHAQDHLGEVVFVEPPEPGGSVSQGDNFGAVESVKATSDVNSPISGEVVEVNTK